jgi:purine-binding chemotaxis protein CheW
MSFQVGDAMSELLNAAPDTARRLPPQTAETFVTFTVQGQIFGIPVMRVQDILTPDVIAPVPLSPAEISGSINLRGRIVTVVDVRARLMLPPADSGKSRSMGVTVESDGEFYTLLVDGVGDVVNLPVHDREANPPTLDPLWREIAEGVYRVDGGLLVALNVERLLDIRAKI